MKANCGEITKKIAMRIKLERTKKNISQEELAFSAGLNKNTIGKIERVETSPTIETIEKIAIALGVDFLNLVDVSKFSF